jgi:hypothetical protein
MKPVKTQIDLCIQGSHLRVDSISDLLGISPTSGFNPHEAYRGKVKIGSSIFEVERNRPSFGVWHFSTGSLVDSNNLDNHAAFLLEKLEGSRPTMESLLQSGQYEVTISIWYVGPAGFDISSRFLVRLAEISNRVRVTCFEETNEQAKE